MYYRWEGEGIYKRCMRVNTANDTGTQVGNLNCGTGSVGGGGRVRRGFRRADGEFGENDWASGVEEVSDNLFGELEQDNDLSSEGKRESVGYDFNKQDIPMFDYADGDSDDFFGADGDCQIMMNAGGFDDVSTGDMYASGGLNNIERNASPHTRKLLEEWLNISLPAKFELLKDTRFYFLSDYDKIGIKNKQEVLKKGEINIIGKKELNGWKKYKLDNGLYFDVYNFGGLIKSPRINDADMTSIPSTAPSTTSTAPSTASNKYIAKKDLKIGSDWIRKGQTIFGIIDIKNNAIYFGNGNGKVFPKGRVWKNKWISVNYDKWFKKIG